MKKSKLVAGVGVNDADYPVSIYAAFGGRRKRLLPCPIYQAWANMLNRCYSKKYQDMWPTYIGCSASPKWHSFSAFREWALDQPWEGAELDKDILHPGNKVYSPETCVFVSAQLNTFLNDCGAAQGELPTGVTRHKARGKLMAQCRNPFTRKNEYLGLFTDPASAHESW